MSSFCNSTTSDVQYAVRAQATSLSESDAMHLTSAAVGSPVSSRDAAAGTAAAAATGITVPSIAAPIGSATAALVSNTRRALGGVAHDPMARACCNAMLAGYADATPAAGDRAVALLQILRECVCPPASSLCKCAPHLRTNGTLHLCRRHVPVSYPCGPPAAVQRSTDSCS